MESEAQIYEAIARGWCHETNSGKEMDPLLGEAIAIEVLAVVRPLVDKCNVQREALDALGLALTGCGHQWTDEQRALYEAATMGATNV